VKLRQTVFDSASERALFRALDSRWSPRLSLYPSMPLAKMIELESSDNLPASHRRFGLPSAPASTKEPEPILSADDDIPF
jgi:hypothetical protein